MANSDPLGAERVPSAAPTREPAALLRCFSWPTLAGRAGPWQDAPVTRAPKLNHDRLRLLTGAAGVVLGEGHPTTQVLARAITTWAPSDVARARISLTLSRWLSSTPKARWAMVACRSRSRATPTAETALSPKRGPNQGPIDIRTPAVARREDEIVPCLVRASLPAPLKKVSVSPHLAMGDPCWFAALPNFKNFVQAAAKFLGPLRGFQVPPGLRRMRP